MNRYRTRRNLTHDGTLGRTDRHDQVPYDLLGPGSLDQRQDLVDLMADESAGVTFGERRIGFGDQDVGEIPARAQAGEIPANVRVTNAPRCSRSSRDRHIDEPRRERYRQVALAREPSPKRERPHAFAIRHDVVDVDVAFNDDAIVAAAYDGNVRFRK